MPDEMNQINEIDLTFQIPPYLSFAQFNTINEYRFNWMQLILWQRYYTNSRIANSPDLSAVADRFYRGVPMDFYNSLRPFYGPVIAQEFSNLMSLYIAAYIRLVEAQIAGDTERVNAITQELYGILERMADFLGPLNNYWSVDIWNNLFHQYLSTSLQRLVAALEGNSQLVIQMDDRLLYQALIMGDYMGRGIIASYGIQ